MGQGYRIKMRDTMPETDNLTDPGIWYRIRGAMLPVARDGREFHEQLAEVTGLDPAAARDLELEYRRFLYLAAVTDAPREPIGLLRAAWDHHAGFDGYLLDFCPWVLDRHMPARAAGKLTGPAYAAAWFDYATEFGTEPPAPYWPAPESRMALTEVRALAASGAPAMKV